MAAGGGALIVVAMAGAGGAACVFAPVVCESLAALHRRTKIRSRVARGVNKKAAKGSVGIASYSSELVKWLSSTRISGLLHPVSNFSLVRRFAATLEFGGLSYTPVQAIVLGLLAFAITACSSRETQALPLLSAAVHRPLSRPMQGVRGNTEVNSFANSSHRLYPR